MLTSLEIALESSNSTETAALSRRDQWDAENRLVGIVQASGTTGFVYDGVGHRVQETLNGSVIKQWVWCGSQPCEERDGSGNVTKRFYAQGEQISGVPYYFTRDHLGSVREMTDGTGAIRAQYDYDPYGRATKMSGDLTADFGFTGDYYHVATGLSLTMYRAYDPNLGRWLSRDPMGEAGGLNLYGFVGNNPINSIDPFGLEGYWSSVAQNLVNEGKGVLTGAQALDELGWSLLLHPIDTAFSIDNNLSNASAAIVDNIDQALVIGNNYKIPQASTNFACNVKNHIKNFSFQDYGSLSFDLLALNAAPVAGDITASQLTTNNLVALTMSSGDLVNLVADPGAGGALRYTPDPTMTLPEQRPAITQTIDPNPPAAASPPTN